MCAAKWFSEGRLIYRYRPDAPFNVADPDSEIQITDLCVGENFAWQFLTPAPEYVQYVQIKRRYNDDICAKNGDNCGI